MISLLKNYFCAVIFGYTKKTIVLVPRLAFYDTLQTRGGFTIEFSEMRGPNKIFGSFISQNEPNILFGPLISENSIITPPLV